MCHGRYAFKVADKCEIGMPKYIDVFAFRSSLSITEERHIQCAQNG